MEVTKHHLTANADYKVDKPFTIVYDTIAHNKTIDKDNEAQVAAFEKLDTFIQDTLKQYYNMNGFVKLFDKNNYECICCKIGYFDYDSTNDKPYGTRMEKGIRIGQVVYNPCDDEIGQDPQDIICIDSEKGFALIQVNTIYKNAYTPNEICILLKYPSQSANTAIYNALQRNFISDIEKASQLKNCIQLVFKDKEFGRTLLEIDPNLLKLDWIDMSTVQTHLKDDISKLQKTMLAPIIDALVQKYNSYAKSLGYNNIWEGTSAEYSISQSDLESKFDI